MKRMLPLIMLLAMLVGLTGCQINPVTGKSELNFFSRDEEKAMGDEAAPQILAELGGEYPDAQLRNYVTRVGNSVAQSGRAYVAAQGREFPDWEFKFYVVNDSMINAFALPGGHVFITRGILSHMTTEAELAGILGHECSHVFLSHTAVQQSTSILTGLGVAALGMVVEDDSQWVVAVAGMAANLSGLSHSRGDESAADRWGMEFMVDSRYDANGLIGVMEMLQKASSGTSQPEFLSTHPNPENRIAALTKLRDANYANANANHGFISGAEAFKSTALVAIEKTADAYALMDQGDRELEAAAAALAANRLPESNTALANATALYQRASNMQPTHGLLYRKLGQAQLMARNPQSINSLAKARSFQGPDLVENYLYGLANEIHGNPDAAATAYQQVLAVDKNHLAALAGAGRTAEALGKPDQAVVFYRKITQVAPANSELARGAMAKVQALSAPKK